MPAGFPLPYPEYVGELPANWITGAVACLDYNSSTNNNAYAYLLYPGATVTQTTFWRINLKTGTYQRLADPITVAGTNVVGIGMTLICDPSRPAPFDGGNADVWFSHPLSAAPWYNLRYYNAATDVWTQVTQLAGSTFATAGMAAQWTGDAAAIHRCTTISPAGDDTTVVYLGNNAVLGFVHTIATGAITALPAGVARAGAPGNGLTCVWHPSLNPAVIYSLRGGGSNQLDNYTFGGGGTWAAGALVPLTQTFNIGTCAAECLATATLGGIEVVHNDGTVYSLNPTTRSVQPIITMYTATGAPVTGRGCMVLGMSERTYIYVRKPGTKELWRARVNY